jgi:hypothetical protein
MKHYISPQEVKHWIPKARLHIKPALQELEYPRYKTKPDSRFMTRKMLRSNLSLGLESKEFCGRFFIIHRGFLPRRDRG